MRKTVTKRGRPRGQNEGMKNQIERMWPEELLYHIYKSSAAEVYFTISRVTGDEEAVYRDAKATATTMLRQRKKRETRREKRSCKQENRY